VKHLIVHDHQGNILAIAEAQSVAASNGTVARHAVQPAAKQRVAEIELSQAHRNMSWKDLIEGMVVDVSGDAPMLRAKAEQLKKSR